MKDVIRFRVEIAIELDSDRAAQNFLEAVTDAIAENGEGVMKVSMVELEGDKPQPQQTHAAPDMVQ